MSTGQRRERRPPGAGPVPLEVGSSQPKLKPSTAKCACIGLRPSRRPLMPLISRIVVQRTASPAPALAKVGRVAGAVNRVAVKLVVSAGARACRLHASPHDPVKLASGEVERQASCRPSASPGYCRSSSIVSIGEFEVVDLLLPCRPWWRRQRARHR